MLPWMYIYTVDSSTKHHGQVWISVTLKVRGEIFRKSCNYVTKDILMHTIDAYGSHQTPHICPLSQGLRADQGSCVMIYKYDKAG